MYTLTERARVIRLPQKDSESKTVQQSEAQLINSDPYTQDKQMLKLIHFSTSVQVWALHTVKNQPGSSALERNSSVFQRQIVFAVKLLTIILYDILYSILYGSL